MYSVQCSVLCRFNSVPCTVYSAGSTVYIVLCKVYPVQWTCFQCAVYINKCTVYSEQCAVYSVHYIEQWAVFWLSRAHSRDSSIQWTMNSPWNLRIAGASKAARGRSQTGDYVWVKLDHNIRGVRWRQKKRKSSVLPMVPSSPPHQIWEWGFTFLAYKITLPSQTSWQC